MAIPGVGFVCPKCRGQVAHGTWKWKCLSCNWTGFRPDYTIGTPPIVREKEVVREVVLIQCRSCGARYQQGTAKCLTCGANL